VHQLATIQASIEQQGDHIITMLENKIVEEWLVAASLIGSGCAHCHCCY
jgi:hypothetical protein